MSYSNEIEIK